MDRKGTGERDSSKDKSPKPGITAKGSEDAMDVRGGAVGGGGSRQRCDSEGAACSEDGSEHGKSYPAGCLGGMPRCSICTHLHCKNNTVLRKWNAVDIWQIKIKNMCCFIFCRQKTSQGFVIPGVAASPPKFVSLEEIMTAASGMNNMALAHEIAVDKDFKLQKFEPPDNSIHKQVKETIHRVFWNVLDAELKEVPPNYTQAMVLLADVKENLISLLLPQHTKLKEQICEVLDADLIRQQAEKGILDFQHYAQYVISVMGKLCAPVRDEKIRELTQTQGVVPMFRGIMETLDLMKLDMANFTIDLIRPDIIAVSVEYEKKKFAEFLNIQSDGLQHTRTWLLHHVMNARNDDVMFKEEGKNAVQNLMVSILGEAYLDLLEWDDVNPYPETLVMDQARFTDLGHRFCHLVITGSVLLVAASSALPLQGVAAFKNKLKEHINILLEDSYTNKDLEKIMPNVAEQVIKEVAEGLETHGFKPLDPASEKLLKGQIVDIVKEDHKIRQLVRTRVREFILQSITSPTAAPLRVPPGLSSLQTELTAITGQFLRLVSHNRAVFGEYYTDIIAQGISASASPTE